MKVLEPAHRSPLTFEPDSLRAAAIALRHRPATVGCPAGGRSRAAEEAVLDGTLSAEIAPRAEIASNYGGDLWVCCPLLYTEYK